MPFDSLCEGNHLRLDENLTSTRVNVNASFIFAGRSEKERQMKMNDAHDASHGHVPYKYELVHK
jgi:hypothetical protein